MQPQRRKEILLLAIPTIHDVRPTGIQTARVERLGNVTAAARGIVRVTGEGFDIQQRIHCSAAFHVPIVRIPRLAAPARISFDNLRDHGDRAFFSAIASLYRSALDRAFSDTGLAYLSRAQWNSGQTSAVSQRVTLMGHISFTATYPRTYPAVPAPAASTPLWGDQQRRADRRGARPVAGPCAARSSATNWRFRAAPVVALVIAISSPP